MGVLPVLPGTEYLSAMHVNFGSQSVRLCMFVPVVCAYGVLSNESLKIIVQNSKIEQLAS